MIYILIQEQKFFNQIKYVFDNVFYVLGLDYEYFNLNKKYNLNQKDILIVYSDHNYNEFNNFDFDSIIHINNSNKLFGNNYLEYSSIINVVKNFDFHNINVISIYNDDELYINTFELYGKNIISTNIDIISDIFFMLTRYEEVVNIEVCKKERFNRFPSKESIAYKNNFLQRPIVNEHIELLWSWINSFDLDYKRKKLWENKEFAVCLTHDVDMIQKYRNFNNVIKSTLKLVLKNKNIKRIFRCFSSYFKAVKDYKRDPFYTFDYIMHIERKYGFKSSFYFMSGGTSEFDNYYSINDKKVTDLIKNIEDSGFEVGYHCSFNSYNDFDLMQKEKQRLDKLILQKPYGCRQHYLRFNIPCTWRNQEEIGILYDTTLSYADCEGFRCGTCFPFKPYDLLEDRVLDIWEIPLIVMDTSLQNFNYNSYSPKEGLQNTMELIETVKKYNGVFTLLWHNSSFDEFEAQWDGWKEVYEKTMKYLNESNCLVTSGRDIINYLQNEI